MTVEPSRSHRLRRLPLWPFLALAAILFGFAAYWWLWRDAVLERRAVQRLAALPGVSIEQVGRRPIYDVLGGLRRAAPMSLIPSTIPMFRISITQPLPPAAISDLAAIRQPYSLHAQGMAFSDRHLAALAREPFLHDLVLEETSVTDDGLAVLTPHAGLESIRLTGTPIRGPGLASLARLPRLFELSLGRTRVDDASLAHLAGMRPLVRLDLYRTPITDAGAVSLARIPNLNRLYVDRTAIGDQTLLALAKKQRVWMSLSLRYTRITSSGLAASGLQAADFYLAGTAIGDDAAPYLALCEYVDRLDLSNTRFTDAGLPLLRGMQHLSHLQLRNLPLTDRGVLRLLHPDPTVQASLETPAECARALATLSFIQQPPYLWLFANDLQGTRVSRKLLEALESERHKQRHNSWFPHP